MPEELDFAMIDAKEGAIVGIRSSVYGSAENVHNAKVLANATADYLNGLLALQKQIKENYEPALIKNDKVEEDDRDPDDVLYDEQEKLLEEGADNLWYC